MISQEEGEASILKIDKNRILEKEEELALAPVQVPAHLSQVLKGLDRKDLSEERILILQFHLFLPQEVIQSDYSKTYYRCSVLIYNSVNYSIENVSTTNRKIDLRRV